MEQQKSHNSNNSTIRISDSSHHNQQSNSSSSSLKSQVRKAPWDMSATLFGWKCPPKIVLKPDWRVAAGEDSKEVEVQKLREPKVLEADYNATRYMPRNPFTPIAMKHEWYDDSKTPVIPTCIVQNVQLPESNSFNYESQPLDESVMQMINKLRGDERIAASAMLSSIASVLQVQYKCDPDEVFRFLGQAETTKKLIEAYRLQARPESTPQGALTCSSAGTVCQAGVINDQEWKRSLVRNYGGLNPSTSNSSVEVVNEEITDSNVVQPVTSLVGPSTRPSETSKANAVQAGPSSSMTSPATSGWSPLPFPPQMDLTSLISQDLVQHGNPLGNVAPNIQNPYYIRHASNILPNTSFPIQRPNYRIPGIDFNVSRGPSSIPHRPYMGGDQAVENPTVKRMKFEKQ